MFRFIRFLWSYHKLYKYKRRYDEGLALHSKINELEKYLKAGYTNELEFIENISKISGRIKQEKKLKKLKEYKKKSEENSYRVLTKVMEAADKYDKEQNNG